MVGRCAWVAFALSAVVHLVALTGAHPTLAAVSKPLPLISLLAVFVCTVRGWRFSFVLTAIGLVLSCCGDALPSLLPGSAQAGAAALFVLAMLAYVAALLPLWLQSRDGLRILLAIPYAGVVIGLFVACEDGAGDLLPLMVLYAVSLACMAFLSAGVNGLTWIGGTLFLASSSLLAMAWFLPGAWVPNSGLWIMLCYFAAQAFLTLGVLRALDAPRPLPTASGAGASVVILEG